MSLHHTQTTGGFRLSHSIDKGNDLYWVSYRRDGNGRDSYIAQNNGSFFKNQSKQGQSSFHQPNFYTSNDNQGQNKQDFSGLSPKTINYCPNGTGRDVYIFNSNGGFYPAISAAEYQNNFKDQLRISYNKSQEATIDYMKRRSKRMKNISINKLQSLLQETVTSSDKLQKQQEVLNQIHKGSASKQIFNQSNGFITNKTYLERRNDKEMYQTLHSTLLAVPKSYKNRLDQSISFSTELKPQHRFVSRVSSAQQTPSKQRFVSEHTLSTDASKIFNPSKLVQSFDREKVSQSYQESPFHIKKKTKMTNGTIAKDMMKGNFETGINFLQNYLNQRNTLTGFLKTSDKLPQNTRVFSITK